MENVVEWPHQNIKVCSAKNDENWHTVTVQTLDTPYCYLCHATQYKDNKNPTRLIDFSCDRAFISYKNILWSVGCPICNEF